MSRTARLLSTGMASLFRGGDCAADVEIVSKLAAGGFVRRTHHYRAWPRQRHLLGDFRVRLADVPLTHAIAVPTFSEIDMNMAFVKTVRAGTEHRHEARARTLPQAVAKLLGDFDVSQADGFAIGQLE